MASLTQKIKTHNFRKYGIQVDIFETWNKYDRDTFHIDFGEDRISAYSLSNLIAKPENI